MTETPNTTIAQQPAKPQFVLLRKEMIETVSQILAMDWQPYNETQLQIKVPKERVNELLEASSELRRQGVIEKSMMAPGRASGRQCRPTVLIGKNDLQAIRDQFPYIKAVDACDVIGRPDHSGRFA